MSFEIPIYFLIDCIPICSHIGSVHFKNKFSLMKRRVARDKSNKRVLRLLSAEHDFSHDAFQVLCDSSFLRALLQLPECSFFSSLSKDNSRLPSHSSSHSSKQASSQRVELSSSSNLAGIGPFALLRSLSLQALDVLDRNIGGGGGSGGNHTLSSSEGRHSKQLSNIQWLYLPATERVLRHAVLGSTEEKAENEGTTQEDHHNLRTAPSKKAVTKNHVALTERLDKLFSSLRRITPRKEDVRETAHPSPLPPETPKFLLAETNEVKAISNYVEFQRHCRQKEAASTTLQSDGRLLPPAASQSPRTSFLFVGTQSHDVRRLLPDDAALLRITHHPTAMWVEIKRVHYHYQKDGREERSISALHAPVVQNHSSTQENREKCIGKGEEGSGGKDARAAAPPPSQRPPSTTTPRSVLPPADVAFIRYLETKAEDTQGKKRHRCGDRLPEGTTTATPPSAAASSSPVSHGSGLPSAELYHARTEEKVGKNPSSTTDAQVAQRRRRSRESHPNPLSMKKKQKKEVLRL